MINVSTPGTSAVAPRPLSLSPIRRFQAAMVVGDAIIIAAAVLISHVVRFGLVDVDLGLGLGDLLGGYVGASIVIACVWLLLLRALHTYRERILGAGTEEYKRVTEATVILFGGIAIASYIFRVELSRRYFLLMFPIGLIGLLVWRWIARKVLVTRRAQGRYCHNALIVGNIYSSESMLAELGRRPEMGVRFVGACLSGEPDAIPPPSVATRFPWSEASTTSSTP